MAIEFHSEGMKEFRDALRKYELASSRTREEVLEKRGRNLAFALHREAAKVGRRTKKRIRKIPASQMRVRGNDKRSQRQEKARRIFAAGFVAAGWIPAIKAFKQTGGVNTVADVKSPKGGVRRNMRKLTIEMFNAQPGAVEADNLHRISDKAFKNQAKDMRKFLQKKMDKDLERAWRR